ncbi:DUF4377 domain-containing protein [Archangium violaceum]|uniref:DUF4377 domain-containing protein n=1 Tax=Archangium violaceum TaxID=83451 RepID=UPI00195024BD|nr:DUF4377 domain-containing protein [Archangium violaceum]QRN94398.1 DUF4377 domain-containing protein [Archangium violaceum]
MSVFKCSLARFAAPLVLGVLAACSGDEVVVIEHYRAPCTGVGRTLCLLVQGELEIPPARHFGGIEGFTFRDGIRQRIRVRKLPVQDPPQDGSSERWVLAELLSTEPVDADQEFLLRLEPGDLRGDSSTGYFVVNDQALRFKDEATRDRILARNAGSTSFEVSFQHDPTQADRWVALALY